ncbi:Single-stranded DNA-binding protein [Alloactinosynnema sp. L-07]|uniref:single-stranded DNA-binding protein n=1 Tax=Alloactinosynnema sp. L-07 TaxID=1653480 RepID=UPI00065F0BAE|nr:single-stranded DNA-binding protein [Alloactinosynnema sp. L-07]CRK55345.1 Single-stranded DNA-binding protein [Alloactinosynnema sp. L-07]
MYETVVTMVGMVAGEITKRRTGDNVPVMSFRLLTTERRYNSDTGHWKDGDRMFVSVHCWRDLGVNVAASLRRGDKVIVTGRLYHREYLTDSHRRLSVDLDARSVGPDLSRCQVKIDRDTVHAVKHPASAPAQPQLALESPPTTPALSADPEPSLPGGESSQPSPDLVDENDAGDQVAA